MTIRGIHYTMLSENNPQSSLISRPPSTIAAAAPCPQIIANDLNSAILQQLEECWRGEL